MPDANVHASLYRGPRADHAWLLNIWDDAGDTDDWTAWRNPGAAKGYAARQAGTLLTWRRVEGNRNHLEANWVG